MVEEKLLLTSTAAEKNMHAHAASGCPAHLHQAEEVVVLRRSSDHIQALRRGLTLPGGPLQPLIVVICQRRTHFGGNCGQS